MKMYEAFLAFLAIRIYPSDDNPTFQWEIFEIPNFKSFIDGLATGIPLSVMLDYQWGSSNILREIIQKQ